MKDYFDATPVHGPNVFRRRFRMNQRLFLRINNDLENRYDFFKQRMDTRGYLGFTSIQKVTSALRILSYGNTYDINDEYLKMAEKTTRDCLEHFCYGICQLYGKRYLRHPTWNDLQQIYEVHLEKHGIPGMIGSLDVVNGVGIIVQPHDEVNIHGVIKKGQLWYYKLLRHTTFGFGRPSLV
ncbi:hypothetical protein HanRHA438_Chr12g0540051 [Helianthus annuus]|nr:hypothetical protein HanRHA438_Chr12g0540051 [Helianthus annuus]